MRIFLTILLLLINVNAHALTRVVLPVEYVPNPAVGRPISNADIYVGDPNTDPEIVANQLQVSVLQEDGNTVQVSQPLNTGAGGVVLYNGDPVTMLVDGNQYSLKIEDSLGQQIYYIPDSLNTASTTQAGIVELATNAETVTGTDSTRAVTPSGLTARFAEPPAIGSTTPANGDFVDLATTGDMTVGGTLTQTKGSDVASASTLSIGDGNIFDVTGTTTINTIANKSTGTVIILQFDGSLTLTHGAGITLPTGQNIQTQAGDTAIFYKTSTWFCVSYTRAGNEKLYDGDIVQVVNTQTGALSSGTTVMQYDDTIPQNTEGNQFITRTITPTSATNKLKIDVVCHLAFNSSSNVMLGAALFVDSTVNALAGGIIFHEPQSTAIEPVTFTHYMTAGTTSLMTFKVRGGSDNAGTVYFNGHSASRMWGGVLASSITITEIKE